MAPLAHLDGALPRAPDWFQRALADAPLREQVVVDGARIETLVWGERGRPGLLLLHGNAASADWWAFIAPLFARGWRVAAPSWSGMGRSDWRADYSADQFVDEALAVAEFGGLFEGARAPVVVGHSFGSVPTLRCAARAGDRLGAAVIVDAPLFSRAQREARRARRGPRQAPREHRVYPTLAHALTRFRFMPPQPCANLYIADYIARHALIEVPGSDDSPGGWRWRFDPFIWSRYRGSNPVEDLRTAKCPVAVMRGTRSALADQESIDFVRSVALPGTPFVEIPEAHHHVMVDQPLAFVAALDELWRAGLAADATRRHARCQGLSEMGPCQHRWSDRLARRATC